MTIKKKTSKKENSGAPKIAQSDPVRCLLWGLAAGRCELRGCNKYLLTNELLGDHMLYPLGEVAHNAPRSDLGPRSEASIPVQERNKVENLLLLCPGCHKTVDNKLKTGELSYDELRLQKQQHESRIRALTEIDGTHETLVLRIASQIHDGTVAIPPADIRQAIVRQTARWPRTEGNNPEVDIDLRVLPELNTAEYWGTACAIVDQRLHALLKPRVGMEPPSHVSVFGFARIPFLVYFGVRLGDKIPTEIFQKQHTGPQAWEWLPGETIGFEKRVLRQRGPRWALLISMSGDIGLEQLPPELEDYSVVEIRPVGATPSRELCATRGTFEAFRSVYAQTLRWLEASSATEIALVPAVPLSAAVVCGRERLPAVTPPFIIYDRIAGTYQPTITISASL